MKKQVIAELKKERDKHALSQIDRTDLANLNHSTAACLTDRELDVKSQ